MKINTQSTTCKLSFLVMKLLLTVGLIYWALQKVELNRLFQIDVASFPVFAGAILLVPLNLWLQKWRWQRALDQSVSQALLWETLFIGLFLRFVVPGGVGDLGKFLFLPLAKKEGGKRNVLEKMATAFIILFWGVLFWWFRTQCFSLVVLIVLICVVTLGFFWIRNVLFCRVIAVANLFFFLMLIQFWMALATFVSISLQEAFWKLPIVFLINTFPLAIGGLGLRENALLWAFSDLPAHQILQGSLLIFVLNVLFPACIGGFFFLRRSWRRKPLIQHN